jgi:serpin B
VNLEKSKELADKAINEFGLKMYSKMEKGDKSLIFSPLSAFCPLAIAYEGARGKTKREMSDVLGVDRLEAPIHSSLGRLTRDLPRAVEAEGGRLALVNGLWMRELSNYKFRRKLVETVKSHYDAELYNIAYSTPLGEVARRINAWVSDKTKGKINRLVTPRDLKLWVMATVNAVYFKSAWQEPFEERLTRPMPFTLLDGAKIEVPTMNDLGKHYRYFEQATFQALEIPYQCYPLAMIVFLPKRLDGLAEFEKSFTSGNLSKWISEFRRPPYGVAVSLPKFSIFSRMDMMPPLKKMGMKEAFLKRADFTGLLEPKRFRARRPTVFIGTALQEAGIEVNEEGTTAYAATYVRHARRKRPRPEVFRADHPFAFIVYDKHSRCILFMGRVTRPK